MRRLRASHAIATLLAASVAMGLAGCKENTVGPTPDPTPTPGPSQAQITVSCGSFTVAASPRAGFNWMISFPCTVTESAGLGANLNFVRARFTLGGVEIERQEITANDILAAAGTNRVGASTSFPLTATFDFNRGDATGGILDFNFTDDRGNVLDAQFVFGAGASRTLQAHR